MKFVYKNAKSFLSYLQIRDILKENKFLIFCDVTDAKLVWNFKCFLLELGVYSKTIRSPRLHKLFNSKSFYFVRGEVLVIWVNSLKLFMFILKNINKKNMLMGFSCNYSLSNYTNVKKLMLWKDGVNSLYRVLYKYMYFVIYRLLKSIELLRK